MERWASAIWKDFKLLMGALTALVLGSIAFVHNGTGYIQDSLQSSRYLTTPGTVVEKFITYQQVNGDDFPVFNVTYRFNGMDDVYTSTQEINREFYESLVEGGEIRVYFGIGTPTLNFVDIAGKDSARRWGIILGGIFALIGGAMLFFYIRSLRKNPDEDAVKLKRQNVPEP